MSKPSFTAGWTCEVQELSEGVSGVVYDEHGTRIADHLSADRAHLIAASPALYEAAEPLVAEIEHYPDTMGEDDDETVEVRLGDLRYLRRALRLARGEG